MIVLTLNFIKVISIMGWGQVYFTPNNHNKRSLTQFFYGINTFSFKSFITLKCFALFDEGIMLFSTAVDFHFKLTFIS